MEGQNFINGGKNAVGEVCGARHAHLYSAYLQVAKQPSTEKGYVCEELYLHERYTFKGPHYSLDMENVQNNS